MQQVFRVTGMACKVCAGKVEQTVAKLAGVIEARVDLAAGTLTVVGEASATEILAAVKALGFGITA